MLRLLIHFGEVGYGFPHISSTISVPIVDKSTKKVHDIIKLICDDYNHKSNSQPFLSEDDIYLKTSRNDEIDPELLCSDAFEDKGSYIVKMEKERRTILSFLSSSNPSWLQQLHEDPESESNAPNKASRQVRSGHFVSVEPTPLPNPRLIATTSDVADMLELVGDFYQSNAFVNFFSGNMSAMKYKDIKLQSWATPYALSIYGQEMYDNCPFANGNGYGDGRAISIAEIVNSHNQRWEMQLKGAGTTPFSRSADGRAVLRSSVREFLASEAMHHLGISTTRGLSLIVSDTERAKRPWFTADQPKININDPRLNGYPLEYKKELVKHVNSQPNALISEKCAIACRVAPSFLRVGHIELFARRYQKALSENTSDLSLRREELRLIVEHLLFREFGGPGPRGQDESQSQQFQQDILGMLEEISRRLSNLTASWIRVGYCQGNFNSDNCLAAGRTMDYGPFGFVERYEKYWNMWSGGGEKYAFRNQHLAGEQNFITLATSIALLLDDEGKSRVYENIIPAYSKLADDAVADVFRQKLGFREWTNEIADLFNRLDELIEKCSADYTIFWRQLAILPETLLSQLASRLVTMADFDQFDDATLLAPFKDAFYDSLSSQNASQLASILRLWLFLLHADLSTEHTPTSISSSMRSVSPKYVPREWMLVEAYTACDNSNYEPLRNLQILFKNPYDEQVEFEKSYYRKTANEHLDKGGVAYMT